VPGSTVCDGRARACACVRAEGRPDVASLFARLRTVLLHGQFEDRRCESGSVCGIVVGVISEVASWVMGQLVDQSAFDVS